MSRGLALNPASLPFFPGGLSLGNQDDSQQVTDGFESPLTRSSPSPPFNSRMDTFRAESPRTGSPLQQPTLRSVQADRAYPALQSRTAREKSMIGHVETLLADEEGATPQANANSDVKADMPKAVFSSTEQVPGEGQENYFSGLGRPSDSPVDRSAAKPPPPPILSSAENALASSPTSSVSAPSSIVLHGAELQAQQKFDAQVKQSPFIHDILDRLIRCEYNNRELQRELSEVHRKVDILVERSLGNDQVSSGSGSAPRPIGGSYPSSPSVNAGLVAGTPSQISISPPNAVPSSSNHLPDDALWQRLNMLTTSVSQLLALQTQQVQSNANAPFSSPQGLGVSVPPHLANPALGLSSEQISPVTPAPGMLGSHGLPNRPSPRAPAPPARTWSQGSMDMQVRPGPDSLLNQKRRSVVGIGLTRRDSAATVDSMSDNWGSSSARDGREGGPVISKWEHLPIMPDLLRSIAKYGVGPPNKIQQRALPFLLRGADIIAQAPPTQERIAAYVIPAIHIALSGKPPNRGPVVIILSTTVDQATQAQRMIRDLGGPIGVRSALGVGMGGDVVQEIRLLQQSMPHILCGTPAKLHALLTTPGGLSGAEVRFLVLDEVDQLIARNIHEFVYNIVKLLPPPRSRPLGTPGSTPNAVGFGPFDLGGNSPSVSPFQPPQRRFSSMTPSPNPSEMASANGAVIERQTALFSNTVPQDVLNLANAIQLREPVRVLVRRDGNVTHADSSNGSRGLRQFYLYLAFTAGGRVDHGPSTPGGGLGIIGSGRGGTMTNAETIQAREWKLDALVDLFADIDVGQAIVHVGGMTALESVHYRLEEKGIEAVPLHPDMGAGTKLAALNKFRGQATSMLVRQPTRVLVVYDVQVKAPDVFQVPLVINYDLPKAVEEYAHRVAPAISSNYSRAGVVVNFVTATGGDVEMLRSIECFYKIKCPEVPMSLRDVL